MTELGTQPVDRLPLPVMRAAAGVDSVQDGTAIQVVPPPVADRLARVTFPPDGSPVPLRSSAWHRPSAALLRRVATFGDLFGPLAVLCAGYTIWRLLARTIVP